MVSTAPSTSTNSNKPETFTSISDKLKCARDVTVDLVNDAELKDELDEFKEAIDVLWKENDLCIKKANGNVVALYKCQVEATKTYYTAFFKFISEVSKVCFDQSWETIQNLLDINLIYFNS